MLPRKKTTSKRKNSIKRRKLSPQDSLKTHRIGLASFLVSVKKDKATEISQQEVTDIPKHLYEIIEKFLKNLDPDSTNADAVNFGEAEKEFIRENGSDSQDLIALIQYKNVIPSSLCSRCPYNIGCPFYVSNEVCFYLTDPFGMRRKVAECLEDLQVFMTAFLARNRLFDQDSFHRSRLIFMYFAYLYYRVFDDQQVKKTRAPKNRRKSKLKYSSDNVKQETRQDIHKRWQILKIPNQMHKSYYPKT